MQGMCTSNDSRLSDSRMARGPRSSQFMTSVSCEAVAYRFCHAALCIGHEHLSTCIGFSPRSSGASVAAATAHYRQLREWYMSLTSDMGAVCVVQLSANAPVRKLDFSSHAAHVPHVLTPPPPQTSSTPPRNGKHIPRDYR